MKEPYIEGVATHDDPESCDGAREGDGEAFDRGTCGLGIEPRNQPDQGADAVSIGGRQHDEERKREFLVGPARSETSCTHGIFQHGNREIHSSPGGHGASGRSRKAEGRNLETHGEGKSDRLVVPKKPPNNAASAAAEVVEGRSLAKGNTDQQNAPRTQCRTSAPSALDRVRRAARKDRKAQFTALFHHVTIDRLREAFQQLKRKAAPGVDGISWEQYGLELEARLRDLHDRLQRGAYRAKPSRRVYIAKADGRQRPLGIASVEDKLVQRAVVEVMNAIYEQDFLGFSYGFRPGRSQHQALDALYVGIHRKKVNYVLDADIRGFFDAIDHGWLMKFVEHRIADKRILRVVRKWLNAGVMENGEWAASEVGTPQGATISPLLANIYLHYVLDLWVKQWRARYATGELIIVRYADDFVVGFQRHADAVQFLEELRGRLRRFSLELHPDKTRLIAFGLFAASTRKQRGLSGKPETFNFLGLTHICGKTRNGKFLLIRRTMRERLRARLRELKSKLMQRRHLPVPDQGKWLGQVIRGYFAYHAVPTNMHALQAFRTQAERHWQFALARRSQRGRPNWEKMRRLSQRWIPRPKILHPWPFDRFDVRTQGRSRVR